MDSTNQIPERYAHLAEDLAAVAERLRRSTVQIRGRRFGAGSGVIWRSDGLIVTNAHVVQQNARPRVQLSNGTVFIAAIVRTDPQRDLAALTVEADHLPAAVVGDSDALRVGELVLAVGNPYGLAGALTAGIIHTVGKNTNGGSGHANPFTSQRWIRADVRLAPGNSGGPLADASGRVIGINSMVVWGLAMAVPSRAVVRFLRGIQEGPYLGVTVRPVRVPVHNKLRFGLVVTEVESGSRAERAGLLIGDVLIAAGGQPLTAVDDLMDRLLDVGRRAVIQVDFMRGAKRMTCNVAAPH